MYRKGHLGVSLLVFAPIGYTLVGLGAPELAALSGGVMLWLVMLPDIDHRLSMIEHRGPTHSLAFAACIGGIGAALGIVVETVFGGAAESVADVGLGLPTVGFAIGAVAVIAHLIGDTLTPAGVNYLWPLSSRTFSVSLARASNSWANSGLFGLGLVVTAGWVAVATGVI